ncbi:MAG: SDR family NAD(P)-dependent oxidoreductase [Fusobacteriaceae bacterium]|nr:SDR family NAD(P)-dependent oxidoreductase [Fusobacteriaceae bacterium]
MLVLITGATSGIGKAFADMFIRQGDTVICVGRNPSELQKLSEIAGGRAVPFTVDLAIESEIDHFLQNLREREFFPDLVINNAGFGFHGLYETAGQDCYDRMEDVNIRAVSRLTYHFYQEFLRKGAGGLINVASVAGFYPGGPLMTQYYATKAFVKSLTLGLAAENTNPAIKITALCPGPTWTGFTGMQNPRRFPFTLYMTTPEAVARQGYRDWQKGRLVSVPGMFNKIMRVLRIFVPLRLELLLIRRFQARLKGSSINTP